MDEKIKVTQINPHIYLLDDGGESTGYLVIGTERAAMIDTMVGSAGLGDVVRSLTDRPVFVINTHGHPDHIMGNYHFTECYMHPADNELAAWFIRDEAFQQQLQAQHAVMPPFLPVKEGDCFDLGGLTLQVFELAQHTAGGIVLLLQQDRILFTGDAINRHLWMQLPNSSSIDVLVSSLARLLPLMDRADYILHGHARGLEPVSLMKALYDGAVSLNEGHIDEDQPYPWFGGMGRTHAFDKDSVICYDYKLVENEHGVQCMIGKTKLGEIVFEEQENTCCIVHTEVDPRLKGQHMGDRLAAAVVQMIRARGKQPTATCSFAQHWLQKHPEALA